LFAFNIIKKGILFAEAKDDHRIERKVPFGK